MTARQTEILNRIVTSPVTRAEMMRMALTNDGIVKVVVDIKTGLTAAGGKWHSQSRDLLLEQGASADNCWGAKLDVYTGEILFQSQINKDKPGQNGTEEIADEAVRSVLEGKIREYFPPEP